MPDAFVFPGGAVDAADEILARSAGVRDFAVAALRELFEEAGILLARDATGEPIRIDAPALAALRRELLAGASLATLLERRAFALDFGALAYYSNWITPASEPIRFDAHFFIARAPARQIAEAEDIEVHDGVWLSPADAIAAADRGELHLRFPTRKHLERLARFANLASLFEHARARTISPVAPVEREDGTYVFDDEAW